MKKKAIKKAVKDTALAIVDSAVTLFTQVSPLQIGTTLKNAYSNIKSELFNEKLQAFLKQTEDINESDKKKFVALLDTDKEAFFKKLFIVIDRVDEKEKSKMIGKLFKSLIEGKITSDVFLKLASIIDRTFIEDLNFLIAEYSVKKKVVLSSDGLIAQKYLASVGLLYEGHQAEATDTGTGQVYITYHISKLGKLIIKNCV